MNHVWLFVLAFPSVRAAQERTFRWTNRHVLGTELHLSAGLTFAGVDGCGDVGALVPNGRSVARPNGGITEGRGVPAGAGAGGAGEPPGGRAAASRRLDTTKALS